MNPYNFKKRSLLDLPSFLRKLILISLDILGITVTFLLSYYTFFESINFKNNDFISLLISIITIILIYIYSGQYKSLTEFIGSRQLYSLFLRSSIAIFFVYILNLFFPLVEYSVGFYITYCFILSSLNCFLRISLRDLLIFEKKYYYPKSNKKVAIYGAGSAGGNLQNALLSSPILEVILFFDDSPNLWFRNLNGIPIRSPKKYDKKKFPFEEVLLAIPSLTRQKKREIVTFFKILKINVLEIPSLEDLASGKTKIDSLKPIEIEDLLGRERVKSDKNFLGPGVNNKNILITGAGGSIGSQLCFEIIKLNPNKLILLEISEENLYNLYKKISQINDKKLEIHPVLGDACEERFVENIIAKHEIKTIIHSAAYKHVPLVEKNYLAGLRNNIVSTSVLCKLAFKYQVNNFLLISTDKAVRPTNIMGASKRLAELVVLAYGQKSNERRSEHTTNTIFSMVRFGNVLGSSGSVVPLFKNQIKNGGPITITHPEIIRYFMTIQEASQLVLQALSLSKNQDLLLLDMGEPVKIYDLAKQMIRLSGLSIKSKNNPNGDIEIIFSGLRLGEKLYEELLIDAKTSPTKHPLIYKANEKFLPAEYLIPEIENLRENLFKINEKESLSILSKLVKEWKPANNY